MSLPEAQLRITRPPRGETISRTQACRGGKWVADPCPPDAGCDVLGVCLPCGCSASECCTKPGQHGPSACDRDEDLIDEDPPKEHETIAAMAHAMSVAGAELREAVARQVDAERALETERRAAAGVRQRLRDAVHHLDTARSMTGEPDLARYLATAIDQAELPLAEVML